MVRDLFNKYINEMDEKLSGLLSINFINIKDGILLHGHSFSKNDYTSTTHFEAEIAKNALQALKYIDDSDDILKEIIISNEEQMHFIYVSKDFSYLIHLITDSKKLNYALKHIVHNQCNQYLEEISSEEIKQEFNLQMNNTVSSETTKKINKFKQLFFN